jgi:pyruvate-formate lyase-activating enzyme
MNPKKVDDLAARLAQPAPSDMFCPVPFNHLYNDNAGRWRLCCRAKPFEHTVADTTPSEHLNHPLMRRIRKEMLGQRPPKLVPEYCAKCFAMEEAGLLSVREQANRKLAAVDRPAGNPTLRTAVRVQRSLTGRMPVKERCLELKLRIFGNHCNLRCYMCAPVNSSSRTDELAKIREGYWLKRFTVPDRFGFFPDRQEYDAFVEDTLSILPLVRKIRITGGEPFLLKDHYAFLEKVVATGQAGEIALVYDSNLTAFQLGTQQITDFLRHFRLVTIYVSIDNLGPKNDYIRYGSHFQALLANIERARQLPNIRLAVNCSTGLLNAGDVHEIADFFESLGLGTGFGTCVITKPTFLQARHLPEPVKEQYLDRLCASRHRGAFEGLEKMLRQPRDEGEYRTFLQYIHDLDQRRGTDYLKLWPELRPFDTLRQTHD